MEKSFEVTYKGRQITVENGWFSGERLYVDGELQDANLGIRAGATLRGQLKTPEGNLPIKVALGGVMKIHCKIFVDYNLIYSS